VGDREMLSWHFGGLIQKNGGTIVIQEDTCSNIIGYAILVDGSPEDRSGKTILARQTSRALHLTEEIVDGLCGMYFKSVGITISIA